MRNAPSRRIVSPLRSGWRRCARPVPRIPPACRAARERDAGREALLHLLGQSLDHRRVEQPGRDRHHAHADARQFARRRQGHAHHAGLRRGIGGLADLALVRRDRGGVDDHAALAVVQRIERAHVGRRQPQQVEAADQVDADHALERGQRHRPVASDDASGGADAGAVHQQPRRPVRLARLRNRGLGGRGIGDIAGDADAADALRARLGRGLVDVEHRHAAAGARQALRGRGPQPGGAAGDDRGLSVETHCRFPPRDGTSQSPPRPAPNARPGRATPGSTASPSLFCSFCA